MEENKVTTPTAFDFLIDVFNIDGITPDYYFHIEKAYYHNTLIFYLSRRLDDKQLAEFSICNWRGDDQYVQLFLSCSIVNKSKEYFLIKKIEEIFEKHIRYHKGD